MKPVDQLADRFAGEVARRLDAVADTATKTWWERYLKGEAMFRGVKMANTRRIVATLVAELDLDVVDPDLVIALLHRCARQPDTEDKLAGVLLVAEHGIDALGTAHTDALAHPLAAGDLADWNSVDWYSVKVLGPFIAAPADSNEIAERSRALLSWVNAEPLWQRRAGLVAHVDHAATAPELFDGFTDRLLEAASVNATDPTRWSQTSVGWILRELARRRPERVHTFLDQHPDLSNEARNNATKHL